MTLYHGTHQKHLVSILEQGLLPHSETDTEKNWTCSQDGVHFSIGRDKARVETTAIGTPIDKAVVIEVDLPESRLKPHPGPTGEYLTGPQEGTAAYIWSGRVPPARMSRVHMYADFRRTPTTFCLTGSGVGRGHRTGIDL